MENGNALIRLSEVGTRDVEWIWKDRIPRGALTLLDGDGNIGKSTLAMEIATAVSTGRPLPGHPEPTSPAGVLLLCVEDRLEETIRPKLDAMGADLTRIYAVREGEVIKLADRQGEIEKWIVAMNAALLVIDPLTYFLGANANREQSVRDVLTPIIGMAGRHNLAVLGIRHPGKQRVSAATAGLGSVGIRNLARSALFLANHPTEKGIRVLASTKNNLGPQPPAMKVVYDGGRIVWCGETSETADDLLKPATAHDQGKALKEATAFLEDAVTPGPMHVARIKTLAAKAGISWPTLRRAKDKLGVEAKKIGFAPAKWYWHLPGNDILVEERPNDTEDDQDRTEDAPTENQSASTATTKPKLLN